mmetsp:Transcript_18366/g.44213  ORF Transcript_18366/g.44213 Transcript_18366/m.44213 type:complete len:323 (-) Transcript_18366:49-1017(-)
MWGQCAIGGMVLEKSLLLLKCLSDFLAALDVGLAAVLDTSVTQTQRHILTQEHLGGVGAAVHQVNLCDDSDGPQTLWVHLARQLEGIRRRQICVGGHDGENDGPGVAHIAQRHLTRQFLNIVCLVAALHGHPCDAGQVNEGEVGALRRIHRQHYRLVNDALVLSCDFVGESFDFAADLLEVGVLLLGALEQRPGLLQLVLRFGEVHESEFEWSSSADALAARQEVHPHYRLEHAALAAALGTNHTYPGEVDVLLQPNVSQLVHDIDQPPQILVHLGVHLCWLAVLHETSYAHGVFGDANLKLMRHPDLRWNGPRAQQNASPQ